MSTPIPLHTLPDRLAAALRWSGRTQEEIAAEAGVTRRTIHRILHGIHKRAPGVDVVGALARVLGVDPGWLAWGSVPDPEEDTREGEPGGPDHHSEDGWTRPQSPVGQISP